MDSCSKHLQVQGSQLSLSVGQVLADRFEIRELLGTGGRNAVFSALDRERSIEVAIQVILPEIAANEQDSAYIRSEAQVATRLGHPALVETYEVQSTDDLLFTVMELLSGSTLRERMNALQAKGQRFSVDEVLRLGGLLCDALSHVHERTVHGGVSLAHIFLCDDGRVKLTGFASSRLPSVRQSTAAAASMASAPYLAPEQLQASKDVDHRADQYALAAVLYEMLTGQAPVGRLTSARQMRVDTPQPLSRALDRALAFDPAERFTDVDAFMTALTGHAASRRRSRGIWVVAALFIIAVALGTTYPRWGGPFTSMIRDAMHDPDAPVAARESRTEALASAARWRRLAGIHPTDPSLGGVKRADEAMSAGHRHLSAMSYGKAEESFRTATALYEEGIAAATQRFSDEPSRVAEITRDLVKRWDAMGVQINARVAESARRLAGYDRAFSAARTEGERKAVTFERKEAEQELDLLTRLKSLVSMHVFTAALRAEVADGLLQADRQLEASRFQEALSSYARTKARLDELLAWPNQAERTLRRQATLARKTGQIRSALGPAALRLPAVKVAIEDTEARAAIGEKELAAGRVTEARRLFESAQNRLAVVTQAAVTALLARARASDMNRNGTDAILALDELIALDPNQPEALALRSKVLSYRIANSVGMELAFIPPGTFLMGSPPDEKGRDKDEHQRTVRLTTGFYMCTTEVTQAQWSAVMEENPSKWRGDDLPVERVSWHDALEFCRRLSDLEGQRYRLPNEAEWEYACRSGTTTPYSFGNTITTDQANYDGKTTSSPRSQGVLRGKTVPVESFPPNAWGLHDMHGNVWEWCLDDYNNAGEVSQSLPAEAAPVEGRLLRGGSWRNRPRYCRCANRVRDTEEDRLANVGLRVVLESR